jgi:diaminopimelate epimerase
MIVYKTSSAGNVFLHGAGSPQGGPDRPELVRRWCGELAADGMVFYQPRPDGLAFDVWNRDGGRAELSGNGMAGCAAVHFLHHRGEREVRLETAVGTRRVKQLSRCGHAFRLRIEIGPADFSSRRHFPFLEPGNAGYEHGGVTFHPVSVGNPHAVVLLEKEPDAGRLAPLGAQLERAPLFPERCNVEFVFQPSPQRARVFFWERGVGQTAVSSTGSSAVYAVLRRLGRVSGEIEVDGGGEPVLVSEDRESLFVENTTRVVLRAMCYAR